MKRIYFLTALLALLLAAPAGAQLTTVQRYLNNGGAFRIKSRTNYDTTREYITVGADNTVSVAAAADDYSQIWLLEKSGTTYTLRHAGSGLYLPAGVSASNRRLAANASTFYLKYSAGNAEDNSTSYVTISTNENFTGTTCLYHDQNGNVIRRAANNATNGVEASDWVLEQVTSPTRTEIRERLNAQLGYVNTFAADKYYRIRSAAYGSVMAEMTSTGRVACQAQDDANLAQLWKVVGSAAYTRLQNAVTEKYIQKQNGTQSVPYTTAANVSSFARTVLSSKWEYAQTLADANGVGLHCASTQNYAVVGWSTSADASIWYFEEVAVDEAALQAARAEYADASSLQDNAETYTQVLAKYFTDKACTELNSTYRGMADGELTAAMTADGLPEVIQQMALKVKNNAWTTYDGWDKTEKTYRVADYAAYSDFSRWTSIFRQGYLLGRLTNPTGISTAKGDRLTIYVGDIPSGQTVALEAVPEGQASGTVTNLKPGFNAVTMDDAYNL
ncbi:MAG: hypothetical protein IJ729_07035, partial [Alloprevotella sp.]|nr:hypothetical protein [Alloprevotella sp.]